MMNKKLLVSLLALTLSVSGSPAFAKKSKKFRRPAPQASSKPAPSKSKTSEDNSKSQEQAPEKKSGMGSAIAAGVGGAVVGGLAGAAIASAFSGGDDAKPSPLQEMTPDKAVQSATEMQEKAKEAGFSFAKSDDMLKKAQELMSKDDAGKKQAHELAIIVHTWAEAGVKQSDTLKKISGDLGL